MTCRTCPRDLSSTDVRNHCVRCAHCRTIRPGHVYGLRRPVAASQVRVTPSRTRPGAMQATATVNGESWWQACAGDRAWFSAEVTQRFPNAPDYLIMHHQGAFGDPAA